MAREEFQAHSYVGVIALKLNLGYKFKYVLHATGFLESYTYFSHGVNSTFLAFLSWRNGFEMLGVPKVTRKLKLCT